MTKAPSLFLGTQTRILLSEWKALAKIIVAHTTLVKEKPITNIEELESFDIDNLENLTFMTPSEAPHILSEKQIRSVLQGPFGVIVKQFMSAYAEISRYRLELHLSKEDLFKTKRATLSTEHQIPSQRLVNLTFAKLEESQLQLDDLTSTHEQEWQNFIQKWSDELIKFLIKGKAIITEREINELQTEELANDIIPRFIELSMKLPKSEYPSMSFTEYLQLKAHLAVQSALSRQHLPHTEADLQEVLKNFKSSFNSMQQQEKQLQTQQQQQIQRILSGLK